MNKEVAGSLAWGVGIIVLALGATFARQQGYIDGDMVNRIVMGATGLMVAVSRTASFYGAFFVLTVMGLVFLAYRVHLNAVSAVHAADAS